MIEDIDEFGALRCGINHHEYPACLERGKDTNHCGDGIGQVNGYPVSALYAAVDQRVCQTVSHHLNGSVSQPLALRYKSHSLWEPIGAVLEKIMDEHCKTLGN